MALRCTRPILKDEEITIGITELHRPSRARREALRSSYFFDCRCERCDAQGAIEEDKKLQGRACPDKSCSGVCVQSDVIWTSETRAPHGVERGKGGIQETVNFTCGTCGDSWPGEEAEQKRAAAHDLLQRGQADVRRGKETEGRKCMEAALQLAACLHRGNWMVSEIYAELVSACLELEVRGPIHLPTATHGFVRVHAFFERGKQRERLHL